NQHQTRLASHPNARRAVSGGPMKLDWFVKLMLLMIVLLLAAVVFRPVVQPAPVQAQAADSRSFYVEPGYTMLREPDGSGQMYGKVMIDMRTGGIWGFPTLV